MTYKESRLCQCGCGQEIMIKPHHKYYGIPEYIHGHNIRGDNNPMKNSETAKKSGISNKGKKRTDEMKRKKSEAMVTYHLKHPEMGENHSEFMSNNPPMKDVEIAKKQAESMRNSDAAKTEAERQRGGNDVVNHHYIYDDLDASKYTIKMTRSDHSKLHRLLQILNYIVPHINIEGD